MRLFTLDEIDTDINASRACGYEHILEQGAPDVAQENVEPESAGGVWLPVNPLWGLLALRRFELEHAGQAGD